jgi:hypothetical protein
MITEERIAQVLLGAKPTDRRRLASWVRMCEHFAEMLMTSNRCFDALGFLQICGVNE